ncbi:MAG: trigger factor [Pseudomonadota bacterium]
MQVEFEPLEEQVRKVRVTFNVAEVREITDAQAREMAKKIQIPGGYTKLKAKVSRVKQIPAFREQILLHSLEGFVQKAAEEGLKKLPFETIGRPEVDDLPELKSFSQELTVEIMVEEKPKVEDLRYKDLDYPEAPEIELSNEDVDQALEEELDRLTKYEDADETVALTVGDLALLHISVFHGEEKLEVPGTETVAAVVGSTDDRPPAFFKEIAPILTGRKKGDEGELDFDWPEGGKEPEAVAGKSVRIAWKINLARHKVRPELTDEMVGEITQGKETSILAYRGLLRERLQQTRESEVEGEHLDKVIDMIIESNPFPLPTRLLERSVDDRWDGTKKRIDEGHMPAPEDMEAFEAEQRDSFRTEISRDLRKTLLIAQIMEAEAIEPDMDAIGQQAQALMGSLGGEQIDPHTQNMFYSVMTHLTNKDIESKVYRRIMGKDPAPEPEEVVGAAPKGDESRGSGASSAQLGLKAPHTVEEPESGPEPPPTGEEEESADA